MHKEAESIKQIPPEFYIEKAWKQCQRAYMISQNRICERCGRPADHVHHKVYLTAENYRDPDVAYNWENIEALCQACHNREHNVLQEPDYNYMFDANGELIEFVRHDRY